MFYNLFRVHDYYFSVSPSFPASLNVYTQILGLFHSKSPGYYLDGMWTCEPGSLVGDSGILSPSIVLLLISYGVMLRS